MGMSVLDLRMLSKLRQAGFIPECGTVVELGAQQLANDILISDELLDRIRDDFGITTSIRWPRPAPWRHGEAPGNGPLAREFWEWLGFTYAAIDVDNTPPQILSTKWTKEKNGGAKLRVEAKDQFTPIVNGTYKLDDGEPLALAGINDPGDGLNVLLGADNITFAKRPRKVEIQVLDRAGNSVTKTIDIN